MKLIADNGSTKCDWCLINDKRILQIIKTDGINPITQTEHEIGKILHTRIKSELYSRQIDPQSISDIFFYGAGCNSDTKKSIINKLKESFTFNTNIEVESDLLGAARALCGHRSGIACILGTGSNSCYYDGKDIKLHTPALGYILGDEGGGAVLGRKFLNALIKGALPHSMCEEYFNENKLTVSDIIYNVYKGKSPNRFLASTSLFISRHIDNEELEQMVIDNFKDFIKKNIYPYNRKNLALNAVGSMAFHYQNQLNKAAAATGFSIGKILKSPIYELANYHK